MLNEIYNSIVVLSGGLKRNRDMKYIVACLMAFGFYGLTFGQSDTTSRIQDTMGVSEDPTLTCYMVDETTFLCTTEENLETEEGAAPGSEEDNLKEEDILHEEEKSRDEGVIEKEDNSTIEGREEDVTGEPESKDQEFPAEPERESDEGMLPESETEDSEMNNQEELNTY